MWVYQRIAYRFNDLRKYGQEKNHYDNGYGIKSGSDVQTKSVFHLAESGYEVSILSMDTF